LLLSRKGKTVRIENDDNVGKEYLNICDNALKLMRSLKGEIPIEGLVSRIDSVITQINNKREAIDDSIGTKKIYVKSIGTNIKK